MPNETPNDQFSDNESELLTLGALLDDIKSSETREIELLNCDVENFLERKYDQYSGQPNSSNDMLLEKKLPVRLGNASKELPSRLGNTSKELQTMNKIQPTCADTVFGLRITSPLISSLMIRERMASRKFVTFNDLQNQMLVNDKTSDWVVAGVITSKETKVSSKSNTYTIWKLSDLKGDMKTVCVLLFQDAHKELWKTLQGSCVAILNPTFSENNASGKDIACLSINSAKKVLLLGKSKDFGICKAKKKNGDACKNIVNLYECDFCVFHMQKEYKKVSMSRDFQKQSVYKTHGRQFDNDVKRNAKFNSIKLKQKDRLIMDSLQHTNSSSIVHKPMQTNTAKSGVQDLGSKDPIASKRESLYSNRTSATTFSECKISVVDSHSFAKQRAIDMLKKKPLEKVNPNSIRGTTGGKKRALEALNGNEEKRQKIDETRKLHFTSIIETTSGHSDLIDLRNKQEEDKYFNKLEKKEALEEKMLKTYKLSCKAVVCKVCKYTAFSAADRCKEERHELKIIEGVKRFFQCKDCGNRTTTLFKLPKFSCSNCSSSRWERCSMLRDKNVNDFSKQLSLRGDEEKFLGSASSKVNMNLLMP
ncbi:protein MCM10 homolog isoform X1 [Ceratitis capitata]|uniref:protein MCM10 homolog isoform X1 n=1 Tax=Ceratitis capitata TaxID=7213 RepID=UPI000329A320|nr:protein MCM10 homolog isoform X1 [Ceratitis capitata]